jgi:hypothetical protein
MANSKKLVPVSRPIARAPMRDFWRILLLSGQTILKCGSKIALHRKTG